MADDSTETEGVEVEDASGNVRQLREKARRVDEVEAALASARRENSLLKSGIDVDTPMGKFFAENYQGDPSDMEALVEKARELGIPFKGNQSVEGTPAADDSGSSEPSEPTGTDERRTLADGSPADTGSQQDPREAAENQFKEDMKTGATWEEAAGRAFNSLVQAAKAGDQRVVVQSQQ